MAMPAPGGGNQHFIWMIVVGAVLLIAGMFAGSLTGGLAAYTLGQMNQTGVTIPAKYNFLDQAIPILQVVFIIGGIVLLAIGAALAIRAVLSIATGTY